MSKKINFMMLVIGATVGSVVTWQYLKKKYEQIAQEEINSVKEVFGKGRISFSDQSEQVEAALATIQTREKPNIAEYAAKLHEQGYTNYSNIDTNDEKEKSAETMDKPCVIPPEEFGEIDDYERIGLTYYADGVLADDNDELVDDVDDIVGFDSLNHFGDYEDDSVFVRNDRLKCDYEILLDQRKFSDVIKARPHQMEE